MTSSDADNEADSWLPPTAARIIFPDTETGKFIRDVGGSIIAVALIAVLLFSITGLWPPFVSVISGSMEPNLERGDLVLVVDTDRVDAPDQYARHGVVPYQQGVTANISTFGAAGHVIVFQPNANPDRPQIIHRARFWVTDGENWYDKANPEYIAADNCAELRNCPAPHAGFITKGDANAEYDQANGISAPVRPSEIRGIARYKLPLLGLVRITLTGH